MDWIGNSRDFTGMGIASMLEILWQDNINASIYEINVINSGVKKIINNWKSTIKKNGYLDDTSLNIIKYFETMSIKAIEVSSNINATKETLGQSNLDLLLAIDLINKCDAVLKMLITNPDVGALVPEEILMTKLVLQKQW